MSVELKKPFVYIETLDKFNTLKVSFNENNTKYTISGGEEQLGEPDIKFEQIVFINDVKKIWTHNIFYDGKEYNSRLSEIERQLSNSEKASYKLSLSETGVLSCIKNETENGFKLNDTGCLYLV